MDNTLAAAQQGGIIEQVLVGGDLSKLDPAQRTAYYLRVCDSLGLNPYTKPFSYLTLNGRMVLYALKDATDQIRASRRVSITKLEREKVEDVYIVTAYAQLPDGRQDSSVGAVNIKGLQGDNLANAYMKAETKSKRRVTLSICGLGMLDETEIETIPNAVQVNVEIPAVTVTKVSPPPTPKLTPEETLIVDSLYPADAAPAPSASEPWQMTEDTHTPYADIDSTKLTFRLNSVVKRKDAADAQRIEYMRGLLQERFEAANK